MTTSPPPNPADHPPTPSPAAGEPPGGVPGIFQRLDQCQSFPYSKKEYARRAAWGLVRATLFRRSPRRAFRWRAALLRWFGATVGANVYIRPTCDVFHPWLLTTGDWVSLADGVAVYNLGPIRIGSHTTISQGAYLCAGSHDYARPDLPLVRPPITIGSGVWIAAQAFVGPGVTVGDNAVVGARAVVARDVPPGTVVAGNPARVIKARPMPGMPDAAAGA